MTIEWSRRICSESLHVEAAMDEMLFSGGSLNVKMLGGAVEG
jgi:hypothetical protein